MKIRIVLILGAVLVGLTVILKRSGRPRDGLQTSVSTDKPQSVVRTEPPKESRLTATTSDDLQSLHQQVEDLDKNLGSSGTLDRLRANRLTPEEQKSAAHAIEQLNDLRAREIELRLAEVRRQIAGARP